MTMYKDLATELLDFIDKSPSCYHVVDNLSRMLLDNGFQRMEEGKDWGLENGGCYYVTRNDSSLIAFKIPDNSFDGYHMIAAHSDSPTFKIKENPEIVVEKQYVKLNVEKYGGMICPSWFDRPLSVAGRVFTEEAGEIISRLVAIDKDLLMIPNLSIHMNRDINQGYTYNAQTDMLPVYGDIDSKGSFLKKIAECADTDELSIFGMDLFLYNQMKGVFWGAGEEYISAPRLDDLQCAFAAFRGFLESKAGSRSSKVQVYCLFDNEETGSRTKQGAASGFLRDTVKRINLKLANSGEDYMKTLANSFMISADNAHGVHPNYTEKADPTNRPYLNGGIVIKHHANQQYTTDGMSAAVMKKLCRMADVPVQTYANRSDMAGGSTLGNISSAQVAVNTVDIGLAQWAMHSAYETGGIKDTWYLKKLAEVFYSE